MIGVDLYSADLTREVAATMLSEHHIILNRTSETVLRFLPPYILEPQHVDQAVAALETTFAEVNSMVTTSAVPAPGDHFHE